MRNDLSDIQVLAWAKMMRVSRNLLSAVEGELKAKGFPSLSTYDVLLELNRFPDKGLRPFELEDKMLLAQYNISRLISRMDKDGFIKREKASTDGRGLILFITPKGQALLNDMWPPYAKALGKYFASKISNEEAKYLHDILDQLRV